METRPDRFTAFADANVLVPVLWRNLLLSLAGTSAFRLRFSATVLDETRRALVKVGLSDEAAEVQMGRVAMAFPDALVEGYELLAAAFAGLPDPDDAHVIAAAVRCHASVIVTENRKDFPKALLVDLGLEAVGIDAFLADAIDLDQERAAKSIREMRLRLKQPEFTAAALLERMALRDLPQTVALLSGIVDDL